MKFNRGSLSPAFFIFTICLQNAGSSIYSEPHQNLPNSKDHHYSSKTLVPKASLTQKGYIQFLRYVVDVPELTDYTFCIWVRSSNLTYSHPLLSYSNNVPCSCSSSVNRKSLSTVYVQTDSTDAEEKVIQKEHEETRLIRVWISPLGTHVNLEILSVPIFSVPVHIVENEWHHICQSWSSHQAAWSLYLNGKLKANGYAPKVKRMTIDSGGDLVVGQEYTDFDKGLDDGIEGDISGFNFVLASTFGNTNMNNHPIKTYYAPNNLFKREIQSQKEVFDDPFFANNNNQFRKTINTNNKMPEKSHSRRQVWDESLELFSQHKLVPPLPLEERQQPLEQSFIVYQKEPLFERRKPQLLYRPLHHKKLALGPPISQGQLLRDYINKPLGLLLVELSNDCGYLRGAPLSGKGVLVSWTKTEVRVFGGAILKTVPPFCSK